MIFTTHYPPIYGNMWDDSTHIQTIHNIMEITDETLALRLLITYSLK